MTSTLVYALGWSVAIGAIIAVIRFGKIDKSYYPFIYMLWIGSLSEILNFVLAKTIHNNIVNGNIYVLIESLLIMWFFKNMIRLKHNVLFLMLGISCVLFWIAENFIFGKPSYVSSYFRIYYSFITVFLSITMVNILIFEEQRTILKNPLFIICISFILFFTYRILVEGFWLYGLNSSWDFRRSVYHILTWINLISNLLFAIAVLWMSTKPKSILLS